MRFSSRSSKCYECSICYPFVLRVDDSRPSIPNANIPSSKEPMLGLCDICVFIHNLVIRSTESRLSLLWLFVKENVYTLTQSINWAQPYIEYVPLNAGTAWEPALSVATMVRNTILNPPLTWPFNRNEYTSLSLVQGTQDYTASITDFAYLEKVSLLNADGFGFELDDVYNTNILGVPSLTNGQGQPNSCAVRYYIPSTSVSLRFLSVPEQAYTTILTYQKLPLPFTYFNLESVSVISTIVYYTYQSTQVVGANDELAGQYILVDGFANAGNNGTFLCVSSTANYLILTNPNAIDETKTTAYAINESWYPIPDSYMEIYNNLFLAEMMATADDAREQLYRQRGVAALLSKAQGFANASQRVPCPMECSRLDARTSKTNRNSDGCPKPRNLNA